MIAVEAPKATNGEVTGLTCLPLFPASGGHLSLRGKEWVAVWRNGLASRWDEALAV